MVGYSNLVDNIKRRAPTTKTVLTTVCPRVDSSEHQERVAKFNERIWQIASSKECELMDNDNTLLLRNGDIAMITGDCTSPKMERES